MFQRKGPLKGFDRKVDILKSVQQIGARTQKCTVH